MAIKRLLLAFGATVFLTIAQAKDPYVRQPALDVQHYAFLVELNDSTDRISGKATIRILFRKTTSAFFLDFGGRAKGEGMKVLDVHSGERLLSFTQESERINVTLPTPAAEGQTLTFTVTYSGIPEDGLVISRNKFGDRTFFADHWPDRGHLWLPCIDHPSDKATVEFTIIAPEHYRVVASGLKHGESELPGRRKVTQYRESVPIAMKVTAVGVARFSVEESGAVDNVPQSTWVFPQNQEAGFTDFSVGKRVFTYFHQQVGPYAYEKLAHVQSKTRWGGLENAGNIFYNEESVTGKREIEQLIAHETAHQWFGDAVTESDWHHVWLSEGFASYFANLYLENVYGAAELKRNMREERKNSLKYSKTNPRPIVDTTILEIEKVLSPNTYDKASWVLHMLRQRVGNDAFWIGVRDYYARYQNQNVLTTEFRKAMEAASGQDLSSFFDQWLFRSGFPDLTVAWSYDKSKKVALVTVRQEQERPYQFPLDLLIKTAKGEFRQTVQVEKAGESFEVKLPGKPTGLELDPDVKLLFEASVKAN